MRLLLAAAIAVASLSAAPARAAEIPIWALPGPDSYPPLEPMPRPSVEIEVLARHGAGLALAGFYNDPAVLMHHHYTVAPAYGAPVPASGPSVIYSGFGAGPAATDLFAHCSAEADKRGLHGVARRDFRAQCKAGGGAH